MCTHMRKIRNMYTGQELYVKCGKCKACLQEQANARAARISRHCANHLVLFCTLTYDDDSVPYLDIDDLTKFNDGYFVPVYRNSITMTRYFNGELSHYRHYRKFKIDEFEVDSDIFNTVNVLHDFKPLCINFRRKLYDYDRVGVCYYQDGINFLKKLRQNLKRRYNYDRPFQYFLCSEYGESDDSARPHFHCVLFCEKSSSYEMWKAAVDSSWSFDNHHMPRKCEIARKPASYVASYVNSNLFVSKFLRQKPFRAKHSFSQGLGCSDYYFQLDQVLQAIQSGDVTYPCQTTREGKPVTISVPLPSYVIHRYFPKFTGYNRLTFDEITAIYASPSRIHGFKKKLRIDAQQARNIETMLNNRLKVWIKRGDREGFGIFTYLAHIAKFSTVLKLNHKEFDDDAQRRYQAYDNIIDMLSSGLYSDVVATNLPSDLIVDPNDYEFRKVKTLHLEELFNKKDKSRKQNNYRDRLYGYNV